MNDVYSFEKLIVYFLTMTVSNMKEYIKRKLPVLIGVSLGKDNTFTTMLPHHIIMFKTVGGHY